MSFLDECKALVAEFKALLVPDWNISVELFDGRRAGRLIEGECYPDWQYKGGLLRFHDFDRFPVEKPIDPVLLVAHEMGHCVVAVMNTRPDTWERRAEEWIVETFARAMVALKRGMQGAPTRLAAEMRYLMKSTMVRRRMAGAEGKRRMNISKETAQAALDALQSGDNTAAIKVLKAILAEAMGAAETEEPAAEPPMAVDPEKPEANAPPMAMDPEKPVMRTAAQVKTQISAELAQAAADAKRTATLARKALVGALITSAPDVFPEALPDRRARYAAASPEEIERFIESFREDAKMRQGDGRKRSAPEIAPKEPAGSGGPPRAGEEPPKPETASVIPITRTGMFAAKGG